MFGNTPMFLTCLPFTLQFAPLEDFLNSLLLTPKPHVLLGHNQPTSSDSQREREERLSELLLSPISAPGIL